MINMQYSQRYPAKFPAWRSVTYGRPVSLLPLSRSKPAGMRLYLAILQFPILFSHLLGVRYWLSWPVFERFSGLVILFDFSRIFLLLFGFKNGK